MTCTSAMVLGNTRKAWVDSARGNTTLGKWFWQGNPIEGSGWGVIAPGSITSVTLKTKQKPTDRGGHESQLKQNRKQARQRALVKHHATKQKNTPTQNKPKHTKHCTVQKEQARTTRRATILPLVWATHSHNSRSFDWRRSLANRYTRT